MATFSPTLEGNERYGSILIVSDFAVDSRCSAPFISCKLSLTCLQPPSEVPVAALGLYAADWS